MIKRNTIEPKHRVVFAETGKPCPVGESLRALDPIAQPHLWRLEGHQVHADGTHKVYVSRHHPRLGRVRRTFHPRVFGLALELDIKITWVRLATTKVHRAWHETWVGIYLGFLALVGLAFFEQYHLAPEITGSILSIFGGGGESGH